MTETGAIRDRLLHVADLHFWSITVDPRRLMGKRLLGNANVLLRRRHEFLQHRAEEFADRLAREGIRSIVVTGDLTSTSLDKEFELARAFLEGLAGRGLRLLLTPGNHDVYTFCAARNQRFEQALLEHVPASGYPVRETLPGGTPVIMFSTVRPNLVSSRGVVRDSDLQKLGTLLARCEGPLVFATHYPVLSQTEAYDSGYNRRLARAEKLRRLLGESGKTILYVAGHVHRYSLTPDPAYPNITHLTTGPLFRHDSARGRAGEYTVIEVADTGFRVRNVPWPLNQ